MTAAPAIAARDLRIEYGDVVALDGVDVAAPAGAIVALVGPNGAGKTTLMRAVAGLLPPTSGAIEVLGVDVGRDPIALRRRIGFLADFIGLYDDLDVRRNLRHAAARQGLRGQAERDAVDWTVDALDLSALVDRPAAELSRGQRQRVAIGMAIVHRPSLLMLDEPASGLDPEARADLADLLRALQAELGATLIVSSHILAELDAYADRVLILERGRLVEDAPLDRADESWVAIEADGLDLDRLRALPGVTAAEATADGARIACPADAPARAALLAQLIADGAPVAAFAPERQDLQSVYLDRLRAARGAS